MCKMVLTTAQPVLFFEGIAVVSISVCSLSNPQSGDSGYIPWAALIGVICEPTYLSWMET